MLISYDRPADIDFLAVGATALTLDLTIMANGRANERARFRWPAGAQTTSTSIRIYATWGAQLALGAVALIGCTLPAGTRVDVYYAAQSSPTEVLVASASLRAHPLGWRSMILDLENGLPGALDPTDMVIFEIYNDVAGVAAIAANTIFEIGEVWCGKGVEVPIKPALTIGYEDRSSVDVSIYSQPWLLPEVPRRRFTASPSLMTEARAVGRTQDLEQVHARLLSRQTCLVIPTSRDKEGNYSQALVDAWGMLGYFESVPALVHVEARYYEAGEYVFFETPIKQ